MDSSTVITGDIQQVVEEQVQEELQEDLDQEVQEENSGEVNKEIEQQRLQEIMVHNGYSYGSAIQDYVNYAYHL